MSDSNIDVKKHSINEKSELSGISFAPIETNGDAESIIHTELLKDSDTSKIKFRVKDQVSLKRITSRVKQKIKGITEKKVGRVIRVIDKEKQIVEVDFWDTVPAKFPVKMSMLNLVKRAPNPFLKKVKEFFTKPVVRFLNYIIKVIS